MLLMMVLALMLISLMQVQLASSSTGLEFCFELIVFTLYICLVLYKYKKYLAMSLRCQYRPAQAL